MPLRRLCTALKLDLRNFEKLFEWVLWATRVAEYTRLWLRFTSYDTDTTGRRLPVLFSIRADLIRNGCRLLPCFCVDRYIQGVITFLT